MTNTRAGAPSLRGHRVVAFLELRPRLGVISEGKPVQSHGTKETAQTGLRARNSTFSKKSVPLFLAKTLEGCA